MMRSFLLLSGLLAATAAPMYADTVFNLSDNAFSNGAVATGTVNIDTTTGLFDTANITLTSGATTYAFTGAPAVQQTDTNDTQTFAEFFAADGAELVLDIPGASLVGYAGGSLCSTSNLCDGLSGAYAVPTGPGTADAYTLSEGSLAAATPEPSSLILLGTGLLGAVGAARRRLTRVR